MAPVAAHAAAPESSAIPAPGGIRSGALPPTDPGRYAYQPRRRGNRTAPAEPISGTPAMALQRVAAILALLTVAGCNGDRGQAPSTQSRLEAAIASGATSFDFAGDPAFAWDRMFVFGCYSDRASVENALGFAWPEFGKTTIESSDTVVLVVFVQNGQVVGWYEQPRSIELGGLANDQGYARSQAVFDVDRTGGTVSLRPRTTTTAPATTPAAVN